jgi:hypothetical protein
MTEPVLLVLFALFAVWWGATSVFPPFFSPFALRYLRNRFCFSSRPRPPSKILTGPFPHPMTYALRTNERMRSLSSAVARNAADVRDHEDLPYASW